MTDDISALLISLIWPIQTAHIIVFGAAVPIGFWARRILTQVMKPTPYELGTYLMSMPFAKHRFKATIFGLNFSFNTEILEAFKSIGGQAFRDVFEKNAGIMHFYIARHEAYEAGSIETGYSIIMTNAPLDDSEYYIDRSEAKNVIFGSATHLREVMPADPDGAVWLNRRKWNRHKVNLIYYPLKPIVKHPKHDMKTLQTAEVALSTVAVFDQALLTLQQSKQNEIIAKAADDRATQAESALRKMTAQYNFARRQWSKKDYWQAQLSQVGSPLSLVVIGALTIGAAVFLTEPLSKQFPGYTMQTYIGAAGIIGLVVAWAVGRFSHPK